MKYAYGSDTGLCREMNEDCVGIFKIANTFTVALLLDGMGGANGGQIASSTAYEAMMTELELRLSFLLCSGEPIQQKTIGNELKQACEAVNSIIWHKAKHASDLHGMGTTMVAAVCYGDRCCILNVGDSRCYYVSDGQISQITKDQSYFQYLMDKDALSDDQIENFTEKNIIMSAVGTEETVSSDLYYLKFQGSSDEYLLLSSDGLHDMISDEQIKHIVSESKYSLKDKVEKLIENANLAGGDDNISVAILCTGKAG